IITVDEEAKAKLLADREAEFAAAKEAIKVRYETEAREEGANVKALAEMQTKEIEELEVNFSVFKDQVSSLERKALLSETDYRALPDELEEIIEVGMGGSALRDLLAEVNLSELIESLQVEVEEAKGQRRKKLMKRLRLLE